MFVIDFGFTVIHESYKYVFHLQVYYSSGLVLPNAQDPITNPEQLDPEAKSVDAEVEPLLPLVKMAYNINQKLLLL